MPTHHWGDKTFDWKGLDEAINFIHDYCTTYGRITVSSKEKWGNADIYIYLYNQYNSNLPQFILNIIHKYQIFVYRKAYDKALTRWPHLKKEIVGGMAQWELLEDVMVKHGLAQSFRSSECHDGKHEYNSKKYCKHCFVTPKILEEERREDDKQS